MDGTEKNMFSLSISGREGKANFPQSSGDGKMSINLCNGDSEIKCEEDSSIFNFDSLNLSQPESDTSRDVDLSRSFDFFLEGERLVSSLCGPKIEDRNTRNSTSDRSAERLQENINGESLGMTDEQYESYDKFVSSLMPISPRKSDGLFKKMIAPTEKEPQLRTLTKNTTEDLSIARNSILVDNTDLQLYISTFPSEYHPPSIKDEFKAKPHFRNWGLIRRSPISDLRRIDDGNHPSRKYEKCSSIRMNDLEVKSPFQYEPLGSKSKNNFPTLCADGNDELHCTEAETKILARSRDYALCFADNSKPIDKKSLEVDGCDQIETCDDEISFRKSAIEGCLVFEQIIRDLQLKSPECDLESYCRNVKRCVSIANSLESDKAVAIMSQLILCSLKLADSWSTLNSYFGANGNNKFKPKSEDDCRLFNIFKQWQVGSKSTLDCLIVVIQSLKSCISKTEKPTTNSLEHGSSKSASESNPFFNIKNVQFNSDKSIFQFEQTDKEKDSIISKQHQGNLIEKSRMSNFFNNCIGSKQTNLTRENNDPSNLLIEIQQKAQSLVSKTTSEEKKTKKKWPLTLLDNKRSNPLTNCVPGQNISFTAQNQIEQPIPTFSSGLSTLPNPQINKSIFGNVPMPTINFMSNPFSTALQNTTVNTNSKDYNAIPQLNFMYPQTSINFKPAVQNKDSNNVFKSEELSSQSTIANQTSGFNRTNMYNQQQMNFMSFQPNFNYQPFSFPNDHKNELIYRTNFCYSDGKMPLQPGGPQQPPSAPFFYPPFCSNTMHQMDSFNNKYTQDKRQKSVVDNSEGDENSETYYEIKSYMKPGSYRVPNKSTFNTATTNDNLNYIFEDIVVTGIAVPLTKTESFSPSKKSNSKTNVAAKKSPPLTGKPKEDSAWRAALASAEAIGKLVENLKHQSNKESSSQESSGLSEESSKASATESVICLSSETDSKESDSPNKSE